MFLGLWFRQNWVIQIPKNLHLTFSNNFLVWTKTSILDQTFDFRPNFKCLTRFRLTRLLYFYWNVSSVKPVYSCFQKNRQNLYIEYIQWLPSDAYLDIFSDLRNFIYNFCNEYITRYIFFMLLKRHILRYLFSAPVRF